MNSLSTARRRFSLMTIKWSALGPEGSHHPLADGVRPRASQRCSHSNDVQPGETGIDVAPIDGIAIVDEMSGLPTPGRRLQELAPDPGGARARGDPDLHQLPPSVPDEEEDVQGLEADGLDHELIGRPDALEPGGQVVRQLWPVDGRSVPCQR